MTFSARSKRRPPEKVKEANWKAIRWLVGKLCAARAARGAVAGAGLCGAEGPSRRVCVGKRVHVSLF